METLQARERVKTVLREHGYKRVAENEQLIFALAALVAEMFTEWQTGMAKPGTMA